MMPDGWSSCIVLVGLLLILHINQASARKKLANIPLRCLPSFERLCDERLEGCKYYKKGRVGVCDLGTDTQVKMLALKKGGSHCPPSKNITEPCNTLKCKYRFAGWGSCNKLDNTRVKLFKLRDGQPEACPSEKRKFRQCKNSRKKKGDCRYKKGQWTACDPLTHVKSRSLTLKKGDTTDCQSVKTVIKKCKPAFRKAAHKRVGLPISESSPNESVQSVFSLKLPLPPEQLNIDDSDVTDTTVQLSWRPGVHAKEAKLLGYIIEYFSISGKENVWVTASNDVEDNTFTVRNLQPGTSYMFQVRAKNAIGVSRPSQPSELIRTHNTVYSSPSRPKDLRLTPSSKSVIVDWAPPPGADLVQGYILSYGKGLPDTYTTVVDKHQLYYTIQDLEPNTEYVVKLKAFNKVGEGQPIYDAVKTLKEWTRNSVLMPPVGLQSSPLSESSIVVAWTDQNQVVDVQRPDNYMYKVRYRHQSEEYRYFNTTHTSIQIHQLLPFRDYEVSASAVQGRDHSTWSMSTITRTHEAAPTTSPSDVTVLNDKPSSIAINWQPPVKANGVITGYTILYTTDHTQTDREWTTIQVDGEQLSARVNKVHSEQTYYFKVQARNKKGYGPFSSIVAFTTSAAAPGSSPTDVTVSRSPGDKTNTVLVSWQPPESPNGIITGYLIYYTTDGTQPDRAWVLEGVNGETLSTSITDLTPCTLYFFKMQARNKEGFGPMSSTAVIKTTGKGAVICSPETKSTENLLPPVGLKARKVTAESAVLSWKDITMKGSKELRDDVVYIVRYKRVKPSLGTSYENLTVHDQSLTLTRLEANTEYEMSVKTVWNSVQSPWSLTLTVKTKEAVPGGPPEDVTMTTVSDDSPGTVTVTWQPPAKTNGLITGYLLYYTAKQDAGDGDWVIVEVGGDHLSLVLRDLTLDTKYNIKVQARNREGYGPMSRVVTYTVIETGCIEPGCSRPTNPCKNSPCPRGTTCVTMATEDAKYICMCSDGKLRKDCTVGDEDN